MVNKQIGISSYYNKEISYIILLYVRVILLYTHFSDEGSVKYKNSKDKDVEMSFVETSQNHEPLEQLDGDGPQTTQPTSTVEPDDDTKKQRRVITEEDQSRDCCVCGDSTDCGDCGNCGDCGDCGDYSLGCCDGDGDFGGDDDCTIL